jgi:hypothetical protein
MDNWALRRSGMNCSRCIFFVTKVTSDPKPLKTLADQKDLGRCRRHSPCQIVIGWPSVFDSDWCGDFKLDENKV